MKVVEGKVHWGRGVGVLSVTGLRAKQEFNGRGWSKEASRCKEQPDQYKGVSALLVWLGNKSRWDGWRGRSCGELSSKAQVGVAWGVFGS